MGSEAFGNTPPPGSHVPLFLCLWDVQEGGNLGGEAQGLEHLRPVSSSSWWPPGPDWLTAVCQPGGLHLSYLGRPQGPLEIECGSELPWVVASSDGQWPEQAPCPSDTSSSLWLSGCGQGCPGQEDFRPLPQQHQQRGPDRVSLALGSLLSEGSQGWLRGRQLPFLPSLVFL